MTRNRNKHSLSVVLFAGLVVLSIILGFITPAKAFDRAPFSDIPYGKWYTNAVSYCYDMKYVGGYEDNTFRPDRPMTRAEMAAIMNRVMKLTEKAENTFSDVQNGAWYTDAVLRCVKAGVMSGYDSRTFGVNDPLTREQGAVILANVFQISKQSGRTAFSDDAKISNWAVGSVKAMAQAGYIAGMGDNAFAPKSSLTRAQMCQIIYADYQRRNENSDKPNPSPSESVPSPSPSKPVESEKPSVQEDGFVDPAEAYTLLNSFRSESNVWYWNEDNQSKTVYNSGNGKTLSALKRDSALEETAKIRAKELVDQFSHTRPNGSVCFTAYPQGMMAMGENIAYGFSSAQSVTEAWKETNENYSGQGHRRNMLSEDFNAVGIAGYIHNGTIYWVQAFGNR